MSIASATQQLKTARRDLESHRSKQADTTGFAMEDSDGVIRLLTLATHAVVAVDHLDAAIGMGELSLGAESGAPQLFVANGVEP